MPSPPLLLNLQKPFHELSYVDLARCHAWGRVPEDVMDIEGPVAPVIMTPDGKVPAAAGEVWCLCEALFANGHRLEACAVCFANGKQGALAATVRLGDEDIRVMVPPAPDFVLEKEGPVIFAARFGLTVDQVFPISISARVEFQIPPHRRTAVYRATGQES